MEELVGFSYPHPLPAIVLSVYVGILIISQRPSNRKISGKEFYVYEKKKFAELKLVRTIIMYECMWSLAENVT